MKDKELLELLEWLEVGDPIKDRWDEQELIVRLADALAKERGLALTPEPNL